MSLSPAMPRTSGMASNNLHALLLLSDSALPLGSFAFSSGLESFLAHSKASLPTSSAKLSAFETFLIQSLQNVAGTCLPYVFSAYLEPHSLPVLDNDFDASTPCTVARRASITQGRALLAIWERALCCSGTVSNAESQIAISTMTAFAEKMKLDVRDSFNLPLNGHFSPLFGVVCRALDISYHETGYLFLLNHAKALLSAAVRASVMGPYQSQAVLASQKLQSTITACIQSEVDKTAEEASVTVPTMDLWMGRHELLYSRIFNS